MTVRFSAALAAVAVVAAVSAGTAFGSPVWQPATTLAPAQPPTNVALALDARGDALAVWERFDQPTGDAGVVLASYRQAGSDGWQAPVEVGPAGPWAPDVAFDGAGNATAVWISHPSDTSQPLLSSTRNAATGKWSQPVPVSPNEEFLYGQPTLGVDSAGDAVVAWGGEVAYRPARGAWQPPTRPFDSQEWRLAMASDGSMVLAGFGVTGGYPFSGDIDVSTGSHGSWSSSVKVGATSEYTVPVAAIAPGGNAIVSWATNEHGNEIVYSAVRVGGTWESGKPVSFLDGNAGDPAVAIDDRGDVLGIWNATVDPEASFRPAGSSAWQRPVAVAPPPIQYTQPTLAMDGAGQGVAAWTTYGADAPIGAAWFTGTGWEPAQTIGTQGALPVSGNVPVAIDRAGDAIAIWQHYEGTTAGYSMASLQNAILDNGGPLLHAVYNHVRPRISGNARPSRKLKCSTGSWSGAAPIRFSFRWLRGSQAVGRAQSYRVARADVGLSLSCRVTATNTFGSVAAASSPVRVRH